MSANGHTQQAFVLAAGPVGAPPLVDRSAGSARHLRHGAPRDAQLSAVEGASALPGALAMAATAAACAALGAARRRQRRGARGATAVPLRQAPLTVTDDGWTRKDIRNVAIIAHVDHGKTTLTDALMRQTSDVQAKTSMDNGDIESERGITILAKNAAIKYKGIKINLIDTPGHADFGGEVERILNMADACLLLVDAQEGPMPQTTFVLKQALKLNLRVLVCINKVDKPSSRPDWVLDSTFDLFTALGACDESCDFPVVYSSGFNGVASRESADTLADDLKPMLDMLVEEVPTPKVDAEASLQMLVSNLDYDDYIGRITIGRITAGSLKVGQKVGLQYGEDGQVREATISKLWEFSNNERSEVAELFGGDICAFAGADDVSIGDTIVDPANPRPLPPIIVEEPTVAMEFGANTSPFAGQQKETTKVTATAIKRRLDKEVLMNLALRVEPGNSQDTYRVKGRGTLQLGILIETMRREGFELMAGAPEVLVRTDPETGKKEEPYEEAVVDVPKDLQGVIMDEMQKKNAVMTSMEASSVEGGMVLTFEIPTRNLIGMNARFAKATQGSAVLSSRFIRWGDFLGSDIKLRDKGSIVANRAGKVTNYKLLKMKSRGTFFVEAGEGVYQGMCVGIHNKGSDLEINIAEEKKVTNVRAAGTMIEAIPPKLQYGIDDFLEHMDVDEKLEVTPGPLRLLKKSSKVVKAR